MRTATGLLGNRRIPDLKTLRRAPDSGHGHGRAPRSVEHGDRDSGWNRARYAGLRSWLRRAELVAGLRDLNRDATCGAERNRAAQRDQSENHWAGELCHQSSEAEARGRSIRLYEVGGSDAQDAVPRGPQRVGWMFTVFRLHLLEVRISFILNEIWRSKMEIPATDATANWPAAAPQKWTSITAALTCPCPSNANCTFGIRVSVISHFDELAF